MNGIGAFAHGCSEIQVRNAKTGETASAEVQGLEPATTIALWALGGFLVGWMGGVAILASHFRQMRGREVCILPREGEVVRGKCTDTTVTPWSMTAVLEGRKDPVKLGGARLVMLKHEDWGKRVLVLLQHDEEALRGLLYELQQQQQQQAPAAQAEDEEAEDEEAEEAEAEDEEAEEAEDEEAEEAEDEEAEAKSKAEAEAKAKAKAEAEAKAKAKAEAEAKAKAKAEAEAKAKAKAEAEAKAKAKAEAEAEAEAEAKAKAKAEVEAMVKAKVKAKAEAEAEAEAKAKAKADAEAQELAQADSDAETARLARVAAEAAYASRVHEVATDPASTEELVQSLEAHYLLATCLESLHEFGEPQSPEEVAQLKAANNAKGEMGRAIQQAGNIPEEILPEWDAMVSAMNNAQKARDARAALRRTMRKGPRRAA